MNQAFSKTSMSRSPLNSNMQHPKGQGWAAFDRKQRERQGAGTESSMDHYPLISNAVSLGHAESWTKANSTPRRSFSSAARPTVGFPPVVANHGSQIINDSSETKHHGDHIPRETDATPVKILKDMNIWADQTLIEDVLAAVNNDVDHASALLKAMAAPASKSKKQCHSAPSLSVESCICEGSNEQSGEGKIVESKLSDEDLNILRLKSLFCVPVEPEWEEDDVYLSHRKDAVRLMRMASQHSRTANNAFLRGEHFAAQQYSLRARDEWMAAEKLNASAAKEILHTRNINNDVWKLDLHGLHATEAVNALKDHLRKIESEILPNRSASSDALANMEGGISCFASSEYTSGQKINREARKKMELPEQKPMILHVITGIGNHSRGQAALPTAVKSFLIENGYRFDDARPGVFAVRPKFRHQ